MTKLFGIFIIFCTYLFIHNYDCLCIAFFVFYFTTRYVNLQCKNLTIHTKMFLLHDEWFPVSHPALGRCSVFTRLSYQGYTTPTTHYTSSHFQHQKLRFLKTSLCCREPNDCWLFRLLRELFDCCFIRPSLSWDVFRDPLASWVLFLEWLSVSDENVEEDFWLRFLLPSSLYPVFFCSMLPSLLPIYTTLQVNSEKQERLLIKKGNVRRRPSRNEIRIVPLKKIS